ncbi:merR regulatory family protein [[Clostridium] sordellii VPI 9048]|nr:merR regulatory family protein [[Clostridium] sordellii VPI 9048] [Paeniclostridium sordellii VPI 9048]
MESFLHIKKLAFRRKSEIHYRISSKMYDISHDTLRYYDKIGLLKPNVKKIMDIDITP